MTAGKLMPSIGDYYHRLIYLRFFPFVITYTIIYMTTLYIFQIPLVEEQLSSYQSLVSKVLGLINWKQLKWDFEGVAVIVNWIFLLFLFVLVRSSDHHI